MWFSPVIIYHVIYTYNHIKTSFNLSAFWKTRAFENNISIISSWYLIINCLNRVSEFYLLAYLMHALTALCRALQMIDIDIWIFFLDLHFFTNPGCVQKDYTTRKMPEVRVVSLFENEGRRTKVIFLFLTANPEKKIEYFSSIFRLSLCKKAMLLDSSIQR